MHIVLLSHGSLAKELVSSCDFIMNDIKDVHSVCLDQEGIDVFQVKLEQVLQSLSDQKVLFLCDLNHGSPHNQILIRMLERHPLQAYEIITGMNLPMLMQANLSKHDEIKDLKEICSLCREAGKEGIV